MSHTGGGNRLIAAGEWGLGEWSRPQRQRCGLVRIQWMDGASERETERVQSLGLRLGPPVLKGQGDLLKAAGQVQKSPGSRSRWVAGVRGRGVLVGTGSRTLRCGVAGAGGRAGKAGEVRRGDSQGCAHVFLPKRIRHMAVGVGERGQEQGFCKCKTFCLLLVVQRACCKPAAEGAPMPVLMGSHPHGCPEGLQGELAAAGR